MVEPLSITTGVLALLGTCIKVGGAVKDFHNGAATADAKVRSLLSDVESFAQVLHMMKNTLEEEKVQSSFQATGHMGSNWKNLLTTINDGQNTLLQLQDTLDKTDKTVGMFDGTRKHLRLKSASEEITMYQQQIRSYRDTIQLSLQTVILWNQVTFKESTEKILPNLDELHESIRYIAFDINARMVALQTLVESNSKNEQIQILSNLRNCVQSAASVVSSASTSLGIDHADHFSVTYGSDFGDCFPSKPSETILRWVSSNTVYEFEEDLPHASALQDRSGPSGENIPPPRGNTDTDHSDSDNELEVEMFQALLRRGKEKFDAEDFSGAERLLRNCLSRTSNGTLSSLQRTSKPEVMMLLLKACERQEKWTDVQSLLIEKIASESRSVAGDNSGVLSDMLNLVEVLLKKESYSEALLYGRRALKGYRRMGDSGTHGIGKTLRLLVTICHAEGNANEEEAYAAVLSDFTEQQALKTNEVESTASLEDGPAESVRRGAPYLIFANEYREGIRKQHPALTKSKLDEALGLRWKALDENQRAVYEAKAVQAEMLQEEQKERTKQRIGEVSTLVPATTSEMVDMGSSGTHFQLAPQKMMSGPAKEGLQTPPASQRSRSQDSTLEEFQEFEELELERGDHLRPHYAAQVPTMPHQEKNSQQKKVPTKPDSPGTSGSSTGLKTHSHVQHVQPWTLELPSNSRGSAKASNLTGRAIEAGSRRSSTSIPSEQFDRAAHEYFNDRTQEDSLKKEFHSAEMVDTSTDHHPHNDKTYLKLHEEFADDFLRLQVMQRDFEFYTRSIATYVAGFLRYLSSIELMMRITASPYPELERKWTRFNMSMRDLSTVLLEDHISAVRKRVMEPIEQIIRAYNPPGLAVKKHSKLHLDYEKYRLGMSSGKTKINRKLLKLVNQYESLNENLEMELPKLYTGSRKIGNICLIQFIAIQREWYSIWQDKVRTVLDESQLPKDISDIIETFNRDFKHVEARVQELGIIGGTLLGDTTKGKALSQSTIEDSDALNKSKSQFSNISNHDRGLSTASNKSPSLPTLDFEKRLRGQFTFAPIITSTLGISTDNSKPDRKSSDMSNSASHNVESLPSPARRPFSGIFHSAMPLLDSPEESPQSSRASSNGHNVSGGYNVLYLAASLYEFGFEFNLSDSALKSEAGYPYLTYPAGEVFQVIGEKGELWLAINDEDPSETVGWIWSKHFARIAPMEEGEGSVPKNKIGTAK